MITMQQMRALRIIRWYSQNEVASCNLVDYILITVNLETGVWSYRMNVWIALPYFLNVVLAAALCHHETDGDNQGVRS